MKRVLVLLSLVMLLACQVARGWVPEPGDVWPDGAVPLALEFTTTAPSRTIAWDSAAREAITVWNSYLQRVQLSEVAATGRAWYDNGHNELFFDTKVYGEPFPSGVLAVTGVTTDRDQRVEADIVFNPNPVVPWALYHGTEQPNAVDFRRVVVHELGHVLGLGHPDEVGQKVPAIMNSTSGDIETLTVDDQAGVQALYDRNSNMPPVVLSGPKVSSPEVIAGNKVKFHVLVGGRGPFSYLWYRDGTSIPSGGAVLQLNAATLGDAGNYSVVVSNGRGSVTSQSVRLAVKPAQAPQVVSILAPWDFTITAGTDYTLEARDIVSGDFPVQFEWKKNGVTIGLTKYPNFTIKDVQFSDSGDYTVTATNVAGSATGKTMHLRVAPGAPPQFLVEGAPVAFALGSAATLSFNTANVSGSQPFTFQWRKDGVDIPNATASSLTIPYFQRSDTGAYTLVASNAFGRAVCLPIRVLVASSATTPPIIITPPLSITEFAGADLSFTVTAEGADLNYRWFKDGVPLPDSPGAAPGLGKISGALSASLRVKNISAQDTGAYSVEVSNAIGSVTSRSARLNALVGLKPVIVTQPSPHTVAVGGAIDLSVGVRRWFANYFQQPMNYGYSYQWFKDGAPVAAQTGASFSFTATLADSGRYFVRVNSSAGATDSDTVDVAVTAGASPLITVHPGSTLYDSGDAETLRLANVAMVIMARRAARNADSVAVQLVSASGPAIGGLVPGTYVTTATRGSAIETSKPFTIGFLPAIAPVLFQHPQGRTADLGQTIDLYANATAYGPVTYQWSKDGVPISGATNVHFAMTSFSVGQAGSYRVAVTSTAGTTLSEPAVLDVRIAGAPVILSQPLSLTASVGGLATLTVNATGGALRYQWFRNTQPIVSATTSRLDLFNLSASDAGGYWVVVSNGSASTSSRTAQLRVIAPQRPPEIIFQPESQTAAAGGDVTFVVGADGGPLPDRYQWRKDGVDIPGATDAELRLHGVQPSDAGSYTVIAYNSQGNTTSMAAVLAVDEAGRLVNLATRASVGTGGDVLIAGFVIAGTQPRSVLVRGIGDQLSEFGVPGVLRNPYLKLFDAKSKLIASSDDWFAGFDDDGARNDRIAALEVAEKETGAFPMREDTQDGALVATLAPGSYTAQVSGVVNTTGVALVEVYELGRPDKNRLINMSSRALVGLGGNILIPGLTLRGQAPRRVLIRAVGPGLADFGVTGTLGDPVMTVYRDSESIASNDNWGEAVNAAEIVRTTAATGGFALKTGSRDAALLIDLSPGSYTVQVSGVGGTTGVALVEVYEVALP